MNQTIDLINIIINELTDPKIKLSDTLLKVQVLAFKLKSGKLKQWVDQELNGFKGTEIPSYRKIPSAVFGNLIQDLGFGRIMSRQNQPLPIEYLQKDLRETLTNLAINQTVSELESLILKDGQYRINIPHAVHIHITKVLSNWVVDSAWMQISINNIEGIISSIKSNLLTFLLELADEIGEKENINIVAQKDKIDSLFDKTIGSLSGETVNITIGTDTLQVNNSGNDSKINVAKGKHIDQKIFDDAREDLTLLLRDIESKIWQIPLKKDDTRDVLSEIQRIDEQLLREQPRHSIIIDGLSTIKAILIGVTANALTPSIIQNLGLLLTRLSGG